MAPHDPNSSPSSQTAVAAEQAPTVIDLFSGAGGFSLGLAEAGLRVTLGSDNWKPAAQTYSRNLTDHAFLQADARELSTENLTMASGATSPTVIVGGPPCQGFSSAGAKKTDDGRNSLVRVYSLLAASARPEIVVFENVEGFLTAGGGAFIADLVDPLLDAGYHISIRKVNVANYGIPQLRKRVIALASLGRVPVDIAPTHRAFGAPGAWRVGPGLSPTRTVYDGLAGLPAPTLTGPGSPHDHVAPKVSPLDHARIVALKPGQTMRDLPEELHHSSYRRRANRRVSDGTPTARRGGAPAGLRRLVAEEPSKAITSAAPREFIHPTEDRPLTLRECARLQTFPDWFEFVGSRTDRATMIGNAVPPVFAAAIGRAVRATLLTPKNLPLDRGALVAFDPTAAEGVSPALRAVIEMVEKRYGKSSDGSSPQQQMELQWA